MIDIPELCGQYDDIALSVLKKLQVKASLLKGKIPTNGRNVTLQKVKLARECINGVDARRNASFENSKNLSEDLASI